MFMPSSLLPILLSLLIGWVHSPNTLHHDYCVLGAGPAGLQMGYFLSKSQRDYIILERNSGPGSFFNIYPRHRKLISINKIYTGSRNREFNLRHDWNSLLSDRPGLLLQRISTQMYPEADALPRYLSLYSRELGLKVRYGVDIGRVSASNTGVRSYTLSDQLGRQYSCRVLLVSTGLWVPHQVQFVGSDLVEGYESASVDPWDYLNQAVLILGKGNSAFETAQNILGHASSVHLYSPSPVRLAWQTHYVGDLRAVNNELLDTYQLKSLDGLADGRLEDIAIVRGGGADRKRTGRTGKGRGKGRQGREQLHLTLAELLDSSKGNKTSEVTRETESSYLNDNFPFRQPYDRVLRCLGFQFNFSIFDSSARPSPSAEAKGRLPRVTAWYEGQGTPGLFVLGTAAHSRDYRSSAGGFIHGFRYTVRAVHRVLEQRYHGNAWPSTSISINQLSSWLLRRVNEASGPYQMFGVLGDIVLLQGPHCEYLEEFPLQALPKFTTLSGHQVPKQGLLVLVLEYGLNHTDTLGAGRSQTEWTQGWKSRFLHPVLYFYSKLPTERDMKRRPAGWALPRPDAVHHIIEDFLTKWDAPMSHIQPLRRFLEHCLQTDLRAFFAESCFRFSLTNRRPPPFCSRGYLRKQGLIRNGHLWRHAQNTGLRPASHSSWDCS
ncbi:FAD-dependent oxidoreductase domain-containing protein 2 [Conger conger]|nr:FAD-dependent oxidoreductase domain-containing protein 2 [Conger conger]XP_061079500.1 FAD-dependent oxidoreductase domain-containing protein 2 [Conger conger]